MKFDFTFHNPSRAHFGKTALTHLPDERVNYGDTVPLPYGKNAIKKIGLYDEVFGILQVADILAVLQACC